MKRLLRFLWWLTFSRDPGRDVTELDYLRRGGR